MGLFAVVLVAALALCGAGKATGRKAATDDEAFLALIASYERSQNTRDIGLLQSIIAPDVEVWLPAGQGQPVTGAAGAVKFFVSFFSSFQSINEVVTQRIVSGTSAAIAKVFNAVAANGCSISVPVIQNFESADSVTLRKIHGVWNTTLFNEQFGCHKK
jgi:hypothetical protein